MKRGDENGLDSEAVVRTDSHLRFLVSHGVTAQGRRTATGGGDRDLCGLRYIRRMVTSRRPDDVFPTTKKRRLASAEHEPGEAGLIRCLDESGFVLFV